MHEKKFNHIVEKRLEKIKSSLVIKGKEYRRNNDPLHNFVTGARMFSITPEQVALNYLSKHLISILDMIKDIDEGRLPTMEVIDEKVGDVINYFILMEAIMKDRIENGISTGISQTRKNQSDNQ